MAEHEEYLMLISARLDEALSPEEESRLEAHLRLCPDCRQAEEELRVLHEALRGLGRVEPPDDLQARILSAIAADNVIPFPEKKRAGWRRWLATAAAVAVIAGGSAIYWRQRRNLADSSAFSGGGTAGYHTTAECPETSLEEQFASDPAEDAAPAAGTTGESAPREAGSGDLGAEPEPVSGDMQQESLKNYGISGAALDTALESESGNTANSGGSFNIVEDESAPVSLTPRQALERLVGRLNSESGLSWNDAYNSDEVSCVSSLPGTDSATREIVYAGTREEGNRSYYLFSVSEETPSLWAVSLDGTEIVCFPETAG